MREDRSSSDDLRLPGDWAGVSGEDADDLHRVLASEYRRLALGVLLDDPDRVHDLDELARVLTGIDAVTTERMLTQADYDRVRIRLHHRDLPVLDATGFVSYDADASTIALAAIDDELERTVRSIVDPPCQASK